MTKRQERGLILAVTILAFFAFVMFIVPSHKSPNTSSQQVTVEVPQHAIGRHRIGLDPIEAPIK